MDGLTARQQEVLDYLKGRVETITVCRATTRGIGERFGIRSPNGVMCHLIALERKGYIKRAGGREGFIEILEAGDGAA